MTLYALLDSAGVREDTFIWQESNKKFWFAGATLTISTETKWEPNQIFWGQYYILECNRGIGVWENRVSYIENNKEKHVAFINIALTERDYYNVLFSESNPQNLVRWGPERWSDWPEITKKLESQRSLPDARAILSVMKQWEETSLQTLSWVKDTMESQVNSQDIVEIYVAYYQWLWHNSTKGIVTLGYKGHIWGSIHLHSGNAIISHGALPICNGWFVGIADHNRYLLLWDKHSIKVRTVVFPRGQWGTNGEWKYWHCDSTVLTPENQLVAIPHEFWFEKASREWALCENMEDFEHTMLISHRGEIIELEKSRYGKDFLACLGKQNILIIHSDNLNQCFFSIARIEPVLGVKQKFHPHWQSLATPDYFEVRYCVALRDKTDIFVVFFTPSPLFWGVCLIDAQGQFWQPQILFRVRELASPPQENTCAKREDGRAVVIKPRRLSFMNTDPIIVIEVSDGWGYVKLDTGIAISGPLVPLPSWGDDLRERLDLVFDPVRSSQE